jgi:methyl-accepting chemotaxis protein
VLCGKIAKNRITGGSMDQFLSQFKTGNKLAIGFAILIAFLLGIGSYGMYSAQQLGKLVNDMYAVRVSSIALVDEANLFSLTHNRTIYSLAAEQDPGVIDDILREMKEYETEMNVRLDAYGKTELSAKEAELLKNIRTNWPNYTRVISQIADTARGGNTASAMMIAQGSVQNIYRLIEKDLGEIVKINKDKAKEANDEGSVIASRILKVTSGAMALAVVLGVLISITVTRNIVGPLVHAVKELGRIAAGDMTSKISAVGSDESAAMMRSLAAVQTELSGMVAQLQGTARHLHSSVHDVTESSHQLSSRAMESSDAINSAAASLEQMVVSIDVVGNNADEASGRAKDAGDAAQHGRSLGETASHDVVLAADKVGQTADMIQQLSAQVVEIGTIANVIKDIADQTNLLALNAAIEAARAGEQGRGFAVVADEVRKLAERTTASAHEITSMISAIQGGTNAVVASMGESRATMTEVRNKVAETTDAISRIEQSTGSALSAVGEISSALREQKSTTAGIAQSVENVARLSEENALTAESVSKAMADVRQVAEELASITQRFRING